MDITLRKIATMGGFFLATLLWFPANAQDEPDEYRIKAAILSKLIDFVSWDDFNGEDIRYCVLGTDPFGNLLDDAFSEKSNISLVRVQNNIGQLEDCRVVFVSDSELRNYREILGQLASQSVLTISDISRFADNGGMINLTFANRRVRFRINQETAERVGINFNYQLLKLADIVSTRGSAQ